ncbi:MAG: ribosome biogenesis GTPase YlqF [Oscillospiraceae bacterium]|nr:ribosome biogenesis GTPase YlqF [Oscillospiraceae bacterium]
MDDRLNIQWYPGHMTKARRMMAESLSAVDVLCEVLDARIPDASRNPDIDSLAGEKPRMIVLNRTDLADPVATKAWRHHLESIGFTVIETDARSGRGAAAFSSAVRNLMSEKLDAWRQRGQTGRKIRVMVAGIPNVGKSTLINRLAGRKAAAAGDRPGVTRGRQWITVDGSFELLDTPGILWPKFENPETGELLAVTNAVRAEILDREALASSFLIRLCRYYPDAVRERYRIEPDITKNGYCLLEEAAARRGFLARGGEADTERMANTLLTEYHSGKLGRLTLEWPA